MAKAYLQVYLDKIVENYRLIKSHVKDSKTLCVIKANGYGLGAVPIAQALENEGVDYYAVATIDEAMELRSSGIHTPILLLGYTEPEGYGLVCENDLTLTVYDQAQATDLNAVAKAMGKVGKVHIKIETGLGRLGFFPTDETIDIINRLKTLECLNIEGIYTHFACADNLNSSLTDLQMKRFSHFLESLNMDFDIVHGANSPAIIRNVGVDFDMVRIGIILYGINPIGEDHGFKLHNTFSMKSKIASVKVLPEDYGIGYGSKFVTERDTKVAVVPMGYVDGIPKAYEDKGHVLIGGIKCPILGGICMDQFMVDVSSVKEVKMGDEVVVIGCQNGEEITCYEVAERSGTNCYDLISRFGSRLKRVYLDRRKEWKKTVSERLV